MLARLLAYWTEQRPTAAALTVAEGSFSWAQLAREIAAVEKTLRDSGVRPGDRVALALPQGLDLVAAVHACISMSATLVPIDLRLAAPEQQRRLEHAEWVVRSGNAANISGRPEIIRGPAAKAAVRAAIATRPAGSTTARADSPLRANSADARPVAIVFSSGSCGDPRPVALSESNMVANAEGTRTSLSLSANDRWLCPLPVAHVAGLMVLVRSLFTGGSAILPVGPFGRDELGEVFLQEWPTRASLVPTLVERILAADLDASNCKTILVGGAPLAPHLLARAVDTGLPVAHTYGCTEACSTITIAPIGLESVGWPIAGMDVRIADDGEILVSGRAVSSSAIDADGWLRTGDLGRIDSNGLSVLGRKSTLIISGGENVAPEEVEAVLERHPAVVAAAVLGVTDRQWGERVVALVVPGSSSAELDRGSPVELQREEVELREFCREHLAGFKVPKQILFVPELPRGALQKIDRRGLQAAFGRACEPVV